MAYTQDELKQQVAKAAVEYVKGGIIGVGTGSTANFFIEELPKVKHKIDGAVASSEATAQLHMIKGGGGSLTREKIVAAVAKTFICICDASKLVPVMGKFPLPVEVLPMARSYVARELVKLGGQPVLRDFKTDNGNVILDVHGLTITDPIAMEAKINQIVGVVTNGLFAARPANVLLLATADRVKTYK